MSESASERFPALPYVLPMAGFLLLTTAEGYLPASDGHPSATWYPAVYTIKVVVVTALAWPCRSAWRDLSPRPSGGNLALAAVISLLVALLWVGLDGYYPQLPFLGKRTSFDPGRLSLAARWGFVAVRLFGLAVLVPLVEELFWRSFLVRLVIDADFEKVPVGRVTAASAMVTSVLFGLAHPEWLPGIVTGLAWAWLLWRSKSLAACIVSHVVANLALGIYVIATRSWQFW